MNHKLLECEMSTIAADVSSRYSDVKPEKRVKKSNPFSIKSWWEGQKFEKVWEERNLENGDVFINSIEVDFLEFDQDYFVQHSKELMEKLSRLNFDKVDSIRDKYEFVDYMYSKKYNISVAVYKPELKSVIYKAKQVTEDAQIGGETAIEVFKAVVKNFK